MIDLLREVVLTLAGMALSVNFFGEEEEDLGRQSDSDSRTNGSQG